ncbi:DUF6526 family protein [Ferruginibacter yonginensis]|uniref:DUF6526 family protein n=1 Tax=Ferruginibacter yonginensis TaxID=1310416 RepID=A0ABV8QVD9_9BACT
MKQQNFSNHSQIVPIFHYGVLIPVLAMITCSTISLYRHYSAGLGLMLPSIALLGSVVLFLVAFLSRSFALKAQDRAIRAEENLRYFVLTGKLYDHRLSLRQVIALRFAPNEELVALAQRAVTENLSPKEIKAAIQQWKGDYYRV